MQPIELVVFGQRKDASFPCAIRWPVAAQRSLGRDSEGATAADIDSATHRLSRSPAGQGSTGSSWESEQYGRRLFVAAYVYGRVVNLLGGGSSGGLREAVSNDKRL